MLYTIKRSKNFPQMGSKETGRWFFKIYLSPFLWIGTVISKLKEKYDTDLTSLYIVALEQKHIWENHFFKIK